MSMLNVKVSQLYNLWHWLENKPLGRWLFNHLVRVFNPYTGALKASVIELDKGVAKLQLKDRRSVRNHLHSIHAIALTNLGEFTSGLALISLFPDNMRGIPIEINIVFLKKARGTLTAEANVTLPEFTESLEHSVKADIKDSENDLVASVTVKWKLGYSHNQ